MGIRRHTGMAMSVSAAIVAAPAVLADTLPVPSDDYPDIQTAINAAMPGDEVLVAAGTYTGVGNRDLVLAVEITVRSESGAELCIIDCESAARAFYVTADATIEGFTLTNGLTNDRGGAILIESADPTIQECTFLDNMAVSVGALTGNGGAIWCENADAMIVDCQFTGNTAMATDDDQTAGLAGAIFFANGSDATLSGSTFDGNAAEGGAGIFGNAIGGAIYIGNSSDVVDPPRAPSNVTIEDSTFSGNSGVISGGAIFTDGAATESTLPPSTLTLSDSSFDGNTAGNGGGLTVFGSTIADVEGCTFSNNIVTDPVIGGGAVSAGFFNVSTFTNCQFKGNQSQGGVGGAVSGIAGSSHTLVNCHFNSNTALTAGGAVHNGSAFGFPSTTTMEGCTVGDNSTPGRGGGVFNEAGGTLTAIDCVFNGNTAESPGAGGVQPLLGNGGAVACEGTTVLDGCTFSGNRAIATGDILAGSGGALFVSSGSDTQVNGCTFNDNEATSAGVIGNGFGGAISTDLLNADPASLVIEESEFSANHASIAGGALFLFGGHTVTIESSSFDENHAQSGGAVAFQTGLDLTVRESEFEQNYTVSEITFLLPDVQEQIGGGALAGGGGSTLTVEDSSFAGNYSLVGRGGAVSTFDEGTATITGSTFTGNEAKLAGGAVVNQEAPALASDEDPTGPSTTTMTGCTFTSNRTPGLGGALANLEGSTLTANTSDFDDNTAESPGAGGVQPLLGNGGAFYCSGVALLDGCSFSGNRAIASGDILSGNGGAVLVTSGSDLTVTGCSFDENEALSAGVIGNGFGGAISTDLANAAPATMLVQDSTFNDNHASIAGGAMFLFGAHVATIEDGSSFKDNMAQSGGAIAFQTGMNLTVRESLFLTNFTLADITFLFENAQEQIGGGAIGGGGGGSVLRVEDSSFVANLAQAGRGGAVSVFGDAKAELTNCRFRDNGAMLEGGAVVNQEAPALGALGPTAPATMYLTNCVVACNFAELDGGGVANLEGGTLVASNCTIAHNITNSAGGGLASIGQFQPPPPSEVDPLPDPIPSFADLVNCILWANESLVGLDQIEDGGAGLVKYSLVQGGWPGKGNIDADPMFVFADPAPVCSGNDYRLDPGSPAIDAGNNWGVPLDAADMDADGETRELIPFDLDGLPRFNADELDFDPGCGVPVVVDMGAYEYQFDPVAQVLFADVDGSGAVDVDDLIEVLGAWGPCGEGCCIDDFDLNEDVDVDDLLAVILFWS